MALVVVRVLCMRYLVIMRSGQRDMFLVGTGQTTYETSQFDTLSYLTWCSNDEAKSSCSARVLTQIILRDAQCFE